MSDLTVHVPMVDQEGKHTGMSITRTSHVHVLHGSGQVRSAHTCMSCLSSDDRDVHDHGDCGHGQVELRCCVALGRIGLNWEEWSRATFHTSSCGGMFH